jgi:hypothetical protein
MSLMINFFYKFNEIGWLKIQLNFFRLFYHNYLFCWDMIKHYKKTAIYQRQSIVTAAKTIGIGVHIATNIIEPWV